MEGTISLGIYNAEGKLVRTLHEEATLDAFGHALNGLVTHWDGKDDCGVQLPSGSYTARGFRVAEFKIEGIGFNGNDWISDHNSPHLRRIERIAALSEKELLIEAKVPGSEEPLLFIATPETKPETTVEKPAAPEASPLAATTSPTPVPEAPQPVDEEPETETPDWTLAPAPEGTRFPAPAEPKTEATETPTSYPPGVTWLLQGNSLHQLIDGEANYLLEVPNDGDPVPKQFALSPSGRALFVLGENDSLQRLWGLLFHQPTDSPDKAKPLLMESIHFSHTIAAANDLLKRSDGKPFEILETHKVQPIHNPLLKEKNPPRVTLRVGVDQGGAYLATADGLILDRISETPHLLWAVMGRASKKDSELVIFESDGAVVGEFHVSGLNKLMSFNAGQFRWKAPKAAATPAPAPTSEPTPEASPTEALPSPTQVTETPETDEPMEADEEGVAPAPEVKAPAAPEETPEPTPHPQTPQTP